MSEAIEELVNGATTPLSDPYMPHPQLCTSSTLSVVVIGASGDLAKKKILPALFALYYEGMLPEVGTLQLKPTELL